MQNCTDVFRQENKCVCYTKTVDIPVRPPENIQNLCLLNLWFVCVWIHASDEARRLSLNSQNKVLKYSYHVVTALKRETLAVTRKRTKLDGQRQQLSSFSWVTLDHIKHFVTERESSSSSSPHWWLPQWLKSRVGRWFWLKSSSLRYS